MLAFCRRVAILIGFLATVAPGWTQQNNRLDLDGVPLPERAIARLGSKRFLHEDFVTATAFSPDGKKFASAAARGPVMIRAWPSGKTLKETLASGVGVMRFSPDGEFVVFDDGTRFLHIATDQRLAFDGGSLPVFFPKGKRAAWILRDQATVRIQELVPDGKHTLIKRPFPIKAIGMDRKGNLIAAELQTKAIALTDLTDQPPVVIAVPDGGVEWMDISLDGTRLVIASTKSNLHVFDVATGKRSFPISNIPAEYRPQTLSNDGKLLLIEDRPATRAILWNLEKGKAVSPLTDGIGSIGSFSADGALLATGGRNSPHAPLFWDTKTGQRVDIIQGHSSSGIGVAFAPDGKEAATWGGIRGDRYVWFWDPATGKSLRKLRANASVGGVAYLPNGKLATVDLWDKEGVALWDLERATATQSFQGHIVGARTIAIASDSKRLVSMVGGRARSDEAIVWDIASGKALFKHATLGEGSQQVAFLPGDRFIALVDNEALRLWDYESNRVRNLKIGDTEVAFSPDGWLAAVTGVRGTRIIELLSGNIVWQWTPAPKQNHGAACAIAPDGRTIAVGQGDGILLVFDWALDQPPVSFQANDYGPYGLSFSADGKRLAGVDRTTALVWDVADLVRRPLPPTKAAPADLDAWRKALSLADGRTAYQAAWKLIAAGDAAIPTLKGRLETAKFPTPAMIPRWIDDLKSAQFTVREEARLELLSYGEDALPALEKALPAVTQLEQRRRLQVLVSDLKRYTASPKKLETVRSIFVLEQIATPAARSVLRLLAGGDAQAFLTQQANLALRRLAHRR